MISDRLVTEFGGKFDLNSEEGEGSTFIFTIKLETQAEIDKLAKLNNGQF